MSGVVYVFLDESGNLDFSPSGTRFFVLTSVSMIRPFRLNSALEGYKYDLVEHGIEQQYFHCAEDNARVRARVFNIIAGSLSELQIDSVIVEKSKTGPALTDDRRFYPEMVGYLLKYVLDRPPHKNADEVIVITDSLPLQRRRRAIEKAVQSTLAQMLPQGVRYRILHHDSRSHYGLQIADYSCWAIFRKHERRDVAAYGRINSAVHSEFDIFRSGTRHYY